MRDSWIVVAPDPADSGLELEVAADTGVRFPPAPFSALIWKPNETPLEGDRSETVMVTDRDGDVLTIERGTMPIEILSGMRIAALSTLVSYGEGEDILLATTLPSPGAPTLYIEDPQGHLVTVGSTEMVDGGGSLSWSYTYNASAGGFYNTVRKVGDAFYSPTQFYVAHPGLDL